MCASACVRRFVDFVRKTIGTKKKRSEQEVKRNVNYTIQTNYWVLRNESKHKQNFVKKSEASLNRLCIGIHTPVASFKIEFKLVF